MELSLSRVDYFYVGTSHKNCLKVLPHVGESESQQQKIVAGNREGLLQIAFWNKYEAAFAYKISLGQPIVALQLGGAIGTARDKIFTASGSMVRGFTKKGKMFLEFDTNLAEKIKTMYVMGAYLLVSGKNVFNQFEDCQDIGYFVSDDEINSTLALPADKVKRLVPILACNDRSLKVLNGGKPRFSVNLESIPTTMVLMNGDGGDKGTDIIVGLSDGKFGLVTIQKEDAIVRWIHDADLIASVTSMDFFDLTSDGCKELIIGFDDGTVQIYAFDPERYQQCTPRMMFSQCCNESISSVHGGIFGNDGFEEVIVCTHSGWVFGYTTETTDRKIRVDEGAYSISDDAKQKLQRLKNEIDELQAKVAQKREKYEATVESNNAVGLSALPSFAVNDKMALSREDASYVVTLEVESPIDTILVQSDVPVDLLDVEKNSAVVSFSKCDPETGNFLLVTFRCQANTTRIEVRLRTIEGQSGTIRVYITPRILPKSCQVRSFSVKPLSLHVRTHAFDPNRPYNIMHLQGPFSIDEMHSWLSNCLSEMPERAPSEDQATLTFVSAFLDTELNCIYRKGWAQFKSDNVSTISILKDHLTKEATKRKIQIEMDVEFNEDSILHTLQLIRPKLEGFISLSKQVGLIDALKEIEAHDPDVDNILSAEYKYILRNAEKLRAAFKRQPSYLDRLYGMITDLYIDKYKYNGINVKNRVPMLMEVLERHNFDLLVDFFQAPV